MFYKRMQQNKTEDVYDPLSKKEGKSVYNTFKKDYERSPFCAF